MRSWQNDCVGCPQGCIHCGRQDDYCVVECDECGACEENMYQYNGLDYCEDCLFWIFVKTGMAIFTDEKEYNYSIADMIEAKDLNLIYFLENEEDWDQFKDDCRIELDLDLDAEDGGYYRYYD